jgi:hypothetical protein
MHHTLFAFAIAKGRHDHLADERKRRNDRRRHR